MFWHEVNLKTRGYIIQTGSYRYLMFLPEQIFWGFSTQLCISVLKVSKAWTGCEEADPDMSGHVEGEVIYKVPFSLSHVSTAVRNFDRSSVRSRSFRRLNRAFSVLRRTKSGNAVSNETSEERDNARNSTGIPQEGMDRALHICSLTFCDVSWLNDVTAESDLYRSYLKRGYERETERAKERERERECWTCVLLNVCTCNVTLAVQGRWHSWEPTA